MSSLAIASALLFAAVLLVPIFKRLGLGSVLGYLAAGVLIGPSAFGVINQPEAVLQTAELGVALLLFLIGLELQRERLWALRKAVFGLGTLQLVVCGGALAVLAWIANISGVAAIVVGVALAMTSTAFALPALAERDEMNSEHGRGVFAVLLFQDLSVIPILTLVTLLGAGAVAAVGSHAPTAPGWLALLAVAATVLLGRPLLSMLFNYASKFGSHEIFTAAALLTTVGLAWVMTSVGLTATLGAFLAGVLLADSKFRHQIEASIEPFESLLLGLFFMAVGMSVNLELLFRAPFAMLGLALAILLTKVITFYVARRFLTRAPDAIARPQAIALAVGGEFAFVLFTAAQAAKVISLDEYEVLTLAVALTMVLAPLLWIVNDRLLEPWLMRDAEAPPFDRIDDPGTPVIIAGYGRVGQIVGRVLNMQNIRFTALDASTDQVDAVRRFGNKIYYGDATRLDLLRAAKTGEAKLFVVCVDDVESANKIVKLVQQQYPQVKILARARNRTHLMELREIGVQAPVREMFAGSVQLATHVLEALGEPRENLDKIIDRFVAHDLQMLERAQAVFRDEEKLIAMSKSARAELDSILQDDAAADGRSNQQAPERQEAIARGKRAK
ncbi:MAG: cation:proton antiporter [Rhizobacter sp.]|nr:cation:proton antiporter [Burkholderiales bacterium]